MTIVPAAERAVKSRDSSCPGRACSDFRALAPWPALRNTGPAPELEVNSLNDFVDKGPDKATIEALR